MPRAAPDELRARTPADAAALPSSARRPSAPESAPSESVRPSALDPSVARPILKWAGGKSKLVPRILALLPERISTYHEPFAGGAAVLFALASQARFKRAVLSDKNRELVDVYKAVKRDVEAVIRQLRHYEQRHCRDFYYATREQSPSKLDAIERAARLIYLNKTGYNGLYRVNQSGQFNVPMGRYKNPTICDPERLRAAARALKHVKIETNDFERASARAEKGDAVYFDPPYVPLSKTSSFTAYHHEAFGDDEHERLAQAFARLTERGVSAVLSNSNTPLTRKLYAGFEVSQVLVARAINSKSSLRGEVSELLVSNTARASARSSSAQAPRSNSAQAPRGGKARARS